MEFHSDDIRGEKLLLEHFALTEVDTILAYRSQLLIVIVKLNACFKYRCILQWTSSTADITKPPEIIKCNLRAGRADLAPTQISKLLFGVLIVLTPVKI